VGDRLRPLWDFDDLDGSERRFRELLAEERSDTVRAEVLTQLARAEGLRRRFAEAGELLDQADGLAGGSAAARARVELERGRVQRSSGDPPGALMHFEAAFRLAAEAAEDFVAADAAHMAALAAPDREGMVAWTRCGIELAESSPDAAYWAGPLLNNLGWAWFEDGDYERALVAFERALTARERDGGPEQVEIARYAVARALRALGRPAEAVALLEQAVAWAESTGSPDGWFHEELAEAYAALGRDSDAAEQARLAFPLLERDDDSFADDAVRTARLRRLAGEG
jgi:tetratricopeptide (TPR) repeat protein